VKFAFIAAEHRVTIVCRCMRVTRRGFYSWFRCGLSARAQRDLVLRTKLRAFDAPSHDRYGRRRLWKDLKDGEAVSEKRVRRLMREDVAHAGDRTCVLRPRQRLGRGQLIDGFEVSINCRFLVSTLTRLLAVTWTSSGRFNGFSSSSPCRFEIRFFTFWIFSQQPLTDLRVASQTREVSTVDSVVDSVRVHVLADHHARSSV
jgi:hypothetical protein